MNPPSPRSVTKIFLRTLGAGVLSVAAAVSAAAQSVSAAGTTPAMTVAEIFAGETEDVGPQFLLQAKPAVRRFEVWTDCEYLGTNNVLLAPTHPTKSTLLSAQAGLIWRAKEIAWRGGKWRWDIGTRAQIYRYGFLDNANLPVNFIELSRNNFDLGAVRTSLTWQRGNWLAAGGLGETALRSRSMGRQFYRETVADWQVFRQWTLRPNTVLAAGLDGAQRWTRTDSFGLLPDSWNDRAELSLVATLERRLGAQWRLQPSLRLQATHYTHADRSRNDRHIFARVSLTRVLGEHAEARLSFGHEQRESSDVTVNDYKKWDLGLGGTVRWQF